MTDEEREAEREEREAREEAKRELEAAISELTGQLNDLTNQLKDLEKDEEDIQKFEKDFNAQFDTCKGGFNSIGEKAGNIKIEPSSSIDTSLTSLPDINQGIGNITNKAQADMDAQKGKIDEQTEAKKTEITNKKDELNTKIQEIERQIEVLQAQLNSL